MSRHKPFIPDAHLLELLGCDHYLVELLECIIVFIQGAEDPQSVAGHLLDRVAEEVDRLQILKFLQLPNLTEVFDVVVLQIKVLQVGELQDFLVDGHEVVVGEVDPSQIGRRLPHYVFQNTVEAHFWLVGVESSYLVVLKEKHGCFAFVFKFFLAFDRSRGVCSYTVCSAG